MRSFNSGREWWCVLTPSAKEEPLRFGVQSLVSKEFVTGTDILIGPLTFGKSLPDISMSWFFSPLSKTQTQSFYTRLWQHLHTRHFHLLLSETFSPKCITCCPCFSPCGSIKEIGKDCSRLLWKVDNAVRLPFLQCLLWSLCNTYCTYHTQTLSRMQVYIWQLQETCPHCYNPIFKMYHNMDFMPYHQVILPAISFTAETLI